jgi:molecular chaperone HscB
MMKSINYFSLLQIEESFFMDIDLLTRNYIKQQALVHKEETKSSINIADLNLAYTTLKDDILRAEYLLLIRGVVIDDASTKHLLSEDRLEYFWQCNNFLFSIDGDHDKLQELNKIMQDDYENISHKFNASLMEKNPESAIVSLSELKYLKRILSGIKQKLNQ